MSTELLRELAGDFAGTLTGLLNGTVATDARVVVFMLADTEQAVIAPGRADPDVLDDTGWVPLSTSPNLAEREATDVGLKVRFRVRLDQEGEHLQVDASTFGLCVSRKTGFCPIRMEYDRYKTARQPAHVQIHGESAGLAFAFARAGQPLKPLHKLHIPVGGRRFRPTLEDFIEFLAQEKLIPRPKPGWEQVIAGTRGDWEVRQVRAAVRRFPDAAVAELRARGYTVTEP